MKKITFSILASLAMISVHAQEEVKPWTYGGDFSVLLNQSSFNKWQAGGDNSFSGNVKVNYDVNYKKENWNWDNKFQIDYGITKLKAEPAKKSADRLELNSLLGKKATEKWFYSAFFNLKTQLGKGMDPDNKTVENSRFFSPAFLQVGPGMMWKHSDNLKVNIAPATAKFIFVDKRYTEVGSSFGVEQGKTMRYELGASVSAYYKVNLLENVSFENILNLYSNYLDKPKNIDIDYQANLVFTINKYITTNLSFQTIYDDNAYKGFQTKQVLGIGFMAKL